MLPKNSPLSPTVRKYGLRMFDHGIIQKIDRKYYFSRGITCNKIFHKDIIDIGHILSEEMEFHENFIPEPQLKSLELNNFGAIIIICGGIYLMSMIVFIFELCFGYILKLGILV